jgi:hypothetical protein
MESFLRSKFISYLATLYVVELLQAVLLLVELLQAVLLLVE